MIILNKFFLLISIYSIGYNGVNNIFAGENSFLMGDIIKEDENLKIIQENVKKQFYFIQNNQNYSEEIREFLANFFLLIKSVEYKNDQKKYKYNNDYDSDIITAFDLPQLLFKYVLEKFPDFTDIIKDYKDRQGNYNDFNDFLQRSFSALDITATTFEIKKQKYSEDGYLQEYDEIVSFTNLLITSLEKKFQLDNQKEIIKELAESINNFFVNIFYSRHAHSGINEMQKNISSILKNLLILNPEIKQQFEFSNINNTDDLYNLFLFFFYDHSLQNNTKSGSDIQITQNIFSVDNINKEYGILQEFQCLNKYIYVYNFFYNFMNYDLMNSFLNNINNYFPGDSFESNQLITNFLSKKYFQNTLDYWNKMIMQSIDKIEEIDINIEGKNIDNESIRKKKNIDQSLRKIQECGLNQLNNKFNDELDALNEIEHNLYTELNQLNISLNNLLNFPIIIEETENNENKITDNLNKEKININLTEEEKEKIKKIEEEKKKIIDKQEELKKIQQKIEEKKEEKEKECKNKEKELKVIGIYDQLLIECRQINFLPSKKEKIGNIKGIILKQKKDIKEREDNRKKIEKLQEEQKIQKENQEKAQRKKIENYQKIVDAIKNNPDFTENDRMFLIKTFLYSKAPCDENSYFTLLNNDFTIDWIIAYYFYYGYSEYKKENFKQNHSDYFIDEFRKNFFIDVDEVLKRIDENTGEEIIFINMMTRILEKTFPQEKTSELNILASSINNLFTKIKKYQDGRFVLDNNNNIKTFEDINYKDINDILINLIKLDPEIYKKSESWGLNMSQEENSYNLLIFCLCAKYDKSLEPVKSILNRCLQENTILNIEKKNICKVLNNYYEETININNSNAIKGEDFDFYIDNMQLQFYNVENTNHIKREIQNKKDYNIDRRIINTTHAMYNFQKEKNQLANENRNLNNKMEQLIKQNETLENRQNFFNKELFKKNEQAELAKKDAQQKIEDLEQKNEKLKQENDNQKQKIKNIIALNKSNNKDILERMNEETIEENKIEKKEKEESKKEIKELEKNNERKIPVNKQPLSENNEKNLQQEENQKTIRDLQEQIKIKTDLMEAKDKELMGKSNIITQVIPGNELIPKKIETEEKKQEGNGYSKTTVILIGIGTCGVGTAMSDPLKTIIKNKLKKTKVSSSDDKLMSTEMTKITNY